MSTAPVAPVFASVGEAMDMARAARAICQWTDRLPEKFREESDKFLADAAVGGLGLADLSAMFAEMYGRARSELPDEDPARGFEDRGLRLETTFAGAGVINGDLTPECAAVLGKVLDALSAPGGDEDDRSQAQRYHDALQEAMQRLVTAGLLPERAGQPVKVWAHISLADLLRLDGSSALQEEWTAQVRARWARQLGVRLSGPSCRWTSGTGQDQSAAQPRAPGPPGVTNPPGPRRERVDPDTV